MSMSPTPIRDVDHKVDIIDHVNQDHPEELLAIAKSHVSDKQIVSARVKDIFQEGIQLDIVFAVESAQHTILVPFEIEGSLEERILYLAYASIVKQGLDFSGNGKQFFEVLDKQWLTANIIRLTVKSDMPLPEYYPGYAYALVLKGMQKKRANSVQQSTQKHCLKRIADHLFIWLMKHLSTKNREKLLYKANKNVRLYTLRKSWKSSDSAPFPDRGQIDIYTHGNSAGSQWAERLSIGDVFMSRSQTQDQHPHLANGQALIIADETAYPAAAGIIEHWSNALPPVVIILSANKEQQNYFSEDSLPRGAQLHRVVCAEQEQATEVLRILRSLDNIDAVWAALESSSATKVRHYLRNQRHIKGKNNHTKAYWKLKS
ncbi:SIP domain-containing protein [Agarivorans sp. QJM3NY_29]|uniref:siderophore-interacting protein n=1 Tax=unclassified Agarivorans TaxID=2636026 RepID=UPI003D7D39B9